MTNLTDIYDDTIQITPSEITDAHRAAYYAAGKGPAGHAALVKMGMSFDEAADACWAIEKSRPVSRIEQCRTGERHDEDAWERGC